jgi:hypothetical protein
MDFLELLQIDTKLGHFISDFVSRKNVMKTALSYRIPSILWMVYLHLKCSMLLVKTLAPATSFKWK